jgi:hypothetical protein
MEDIINPPTYFTIIPKQEEHPGKLFIDTLVERCGPDDYKRQLFSRQAASGTVS